MSPFGADDLAPAILAELPLGVWVARAPSGEVLYTNRAFREIMGMRAVPGVSIEGASTAYGIHDRAGNLYAVEKLPFSRVMASGGPVALDDLVIHRADGHRAFVRAFAAPVSDRSDGIAFVIVIFIEITAEVRAIAERKQVEEQLRFAVHHAPVVLFAMDQHGIITLSEGAALVGLGVRSGQLVGQSAFDLYRDQPGILSDMRRVLGGETITNTVDVAEIVLETWLTPIRDDAGEVIGLIGMSTDVTERRRLQARAIQNDRVAAMGALAASVAHEVNNPLTYVLGSLARGDAEIEEALRSLSTVIEGGERVRVALEALVRARSVLAEARAGAERVGNIARDLRTFSRPADDEVRPVALPVVIRAVLQLVRKEIEARARLTVTLAETPPVKANEPRLVQVVLNLLVNAWQALREPNPAVNEIGIRTTCEEGFAVIEVSDTGPGVPLEQRLRIFEPFFTTKDVGVGTGLGLFVCRNIVNDFGGDITITERPGGGALFRVRLPLAEPVAEAPAPIEVPAPTPTRRHRRVLLIDDDERVARALAQALKAEYDVRIVLDGQEALQALLEDEPFDLTFCDLMMKGLTGMDIHDAVRRRAPDRLASMVFMTGGAYTPRALEFVERFPEAVVYKPFDIREETRQRLRPK